MSKRPDATDRKIVETISEYATAYRALEELQKAETKHIYLPRHADQKTGMIGEYWAKRYAEARWSKPVSFADSTSQTGYDLKVMEHFIQVKTVSAYSESRRISPIKHPSRKPEDMSKTQNWHPWTHLWLISLDKELYPNGFWEIGATSFANAMGDSKSIGGATMRNPETGEKGSHRFATIWENNQIEHFHQTLGQTIK